MRPLAGILVASILLLASAYSLAQATLAPLARQVDASVRALIDSGQDINAPNALGITPLVSAAAIGSADSVAALLAKGADPNVVRPTDGEAPLMLAIRRFRDAALTARFLIQGANPNTRSRDGNTALMDAAGAGNLAIVELLMKAGADVNAVDQSGRNALFYASSADIMRRLLAAGAARDLIDKDGADLLVFYAQGSDAEQVREAMALVPDLNRVTKSGDSALGRLARSGTMAPADRIRLMNELLDKGAIPTVDIRSQTILALLAENDTYMDSTTRTQEGLLVRRLARAKINVNQRAEGGRSAMLAAACKLRLGILDELIRLSADVNAADEDGLTPLMCAAGSHGHPDGVLAVKRLLSAGANNNLKDRTGRNALDYALTRGSTEIVQVLTH